MACTPDCAGINHCIMGGYTCDRCGREHICAENCVEDGYRVICDDCLEEERAETGETDDG